MAEEKKITAGGAEEDTKAKFVITQEVADRIEESVKKAFSDLKESRKSFNFHGTESAKQELTKAQKQFAGAEFVKAIATNDVATAQKYHNERLTRNKTLNVTTDANGGYLVPDVHESEIYETFDNYSEIIRDCDVKTYNRAGRVFDLNELDTRVQVYFTDENSTGTTASTPTFAAPQIAVYDILGSADMTQDFLEDQEADIMGSLSRQFGEAMAKGIQDRLINRTVTVSGVVMPGIATVAGTTVSMGATGGGYTGVTFRDFRDMYYNAIAIDHFQDSNMDGKFYLHPFAVQAATNNAENTTVSNFFINPFAQLPTDIAGRPYVMTNQMPTPATTTSNVFAVYGNLSRHVKIRRKRGVTMKLNDSGTSLGGRNLNYQLGREIVMSQRLGHQIILRDGLVQLVTA